MSSKVLRKLYGEPDLANELGAEVNSDTEIDLPGSGGAKKKQLNINRYNLLNQQSLSESEVKEDDDHETEAANAGDELGDGRDSTRRKKKKKKKKAVKSSNNKRSSEDNLEADEIERSVQEVSKFLGELPTVCKNISEDSRNTTPRKGILSIEHRNLNPNNEIKRIFGSKVVQAEQNKRRGRGRGHLKSTWLVSARDSWPQVGKPGLSMKYEGSSNGIQRFVYQHNAHYQQIQMKFLEAIDSLNPDNIVSIINTHPYHVDALIQLSDLCKLSEDMQMAAELIERALYCLECAFHPLFNVAQGNCQLEYRRQENRSLFIALFKHLTFVGQRACHRTALEFCKLLLSLDPENDPLAVVLLMDFYALRSHEYTWLIQVFHEWETQKNLSQLPNFAFSVAVAHFQLALQGGRENPDAEMTEADICLQNALIMFPSVLMPLLDKCSIQPDPRVSSHSFFGLKAQNSQPPALSQLVQLYVNRSYHTWKKPDLLPWLEKNVNIVLDRVDSGDSYVKDCEEKRLKLYHGTPRNIYRHIILSDIKTVTAAVSEDMQGPILSFDPLPPPDSVNLYTRPPRPRLYDDANTFSLFFRSLLPNFSINEPLREAQVEGGEDIEGASGIDLRRSVTSLLDAMRDLLSNIHLPDVPNDADVDESEEEPEERP